MQEQIEYVDIEWVKLMLIARDLGFTPEEVRLFLLKNTSLLEASEA